MRRRVARSRGLGFILYSVRYHGRYHGGGILRDLQKLSFLFVKLCAKERVNTNMRPRRDFRDAYVHHTLDNRMGISRISVGFYHNRIPAAASNMHQ